MKTNKTYIVGLLLLLFGTTGCENKLLNLTPESVLTTSNFYQKANDINQAVLGTYNSLQTRRQTDYLLMEVPSDNLYMSTNTTIAGSQDVDYLTANADNALVSAFWNNTYNGIFRANSVLMNIDKPTDYAAAMKDQYIGEAKFMRALFYFDLVRMFGGVPKVTTKLSIQEAAGTAKSTADEIYALIIEDLTDAISKLPLQSGIAKGRASKGAAAGLLGKVYVYKKDYANAKTYLEQVIKNYNYTLVSDFSSLWKVATEDNSEVLFSVKYIDGTNGQSLTTSYTLNGGIIGVADRGNETALPSWSLMKKYETTDTRKAVTFQEMWTSPTTPNATPIWYPYVNKYAVAHTINASGLDIPVLRYADIILLYAETLNGLGLNAEALVQLNTIRERAFKNSAHNYTAADVWSSALFSDKLFLERQLELAYEHERWFDLVRSGKYMTELTKEERLYNNITLTPVTAALSPAVYKSIYPIPQAQIDLSPNLKQNAQY